MSKKQTESKPTEVKLDDMKKVVGGITMKRRSGQNDQGQNDNSQGDEPGRTKLGDKLFSPYY
jgi:hypothetical protein